MTQTQTIETGLVVIGKSKVDNLLIQSIINTEGFYAEFNEEFGCFTFPEEPSCYDKLETTLDKLFSQNGVNVRFEALWPTEDFSNDYSEDDDIDPAGGYGLHSHE